MKTFIQIFAILLSASFSIYAQDKGNLENIEQAKILKTIEDIDHLNPLIDNDKYIVSDTLSFFIYSIYYISQWGDFSFGHYKDEQVMDDFSAIIMLARGNGFEIPILVEELFNKVEKISFYHKNDVVLVKIKTLSSKPLKIKLDQTVNSEKINKILNLTIFDGAMFKFEIPNNDEVLKILGFKKGILAPFSTSSVMPELENYILQEDLWKIPVLNTTINKIELSFSDHKDKKTHMAIKHIVVMPGATDKHGDRISSIGISASVYKIFSVKVSVDL